MRPITREHLSEALCAFFRTRIEVLPSREGEWVVALPMVDEHNDPIELVLHQLDEALVLSDGGFLHREVALKTTQERADAPVWEHVRAAATRLDVEWGDGVLWKHLTPSDDLGDSLLRMANAITLGLQASSQYVSKVGVHFWEEVRLFFEDEDIEYVRNAKLTGVSQVPHRVDFTLRNGHVHVVQAVASEIAMRRSLNVFYDLLEANPDIVPISFVDDAKTGYSNETFEQLSYKSDVYVWTQRRRFLEYWASTA